MAPLRVLSTEVAWLPWGSAAFARARAGHKPVLLSIAAAWCHWCHEMDRTSYADPEIATFINECFVPVRIDADQRPDISERYNLGGWPTTAFLTPDGEILAGGTFVPMERMRAVLTQVADAFAAGSHTITPAAPAAIRAPLPVEVDAAALTAAVFATFDPVHGGFGVEPKFPLTAPLHLALELFQETQDPVAYATAVGTLDAMGWSALYDDVDGGFFRYATTRDWQLPHHEKLLETNASLLRLYLEAGEVLKVARFTDRAADTLRYIQNSLADPVDGGWRSSQNADENYYAAASVEQRRTLPGPAVSDALYADANAAMVSAALQASRVFNDDGLREFAVKSLERVLLACYKAGSGVAHYADGRPQVRGLLIDQLAMAAACLDVFEITDNVVYEMMAEELAHYAIRVMWDERGGGFYDRTQDDSEQPIGLMGHTLKPFVTNCEASRTLRRLAARSGNHEFTDYADRILAAVAPLAAEQGPLAAHYLLALRAAQPPRSD